MAEDFNALTLSRALWRERVPSGGFCIDATAGRGRDTLYLCGLVGQQGRVLAFDIQKDAVDSTRALLEQEGCSGIARVIRDSHSNMAAYAGPESADCIVFNFGWLPGGDHSVFTRTDTSIAAVKAGLSLLRPGGVMTLCIYYGKETGFAERDALLSYLPTIDSAHFTVLVHQFVNRPNNPPIAAFVYRERG